METYFAKDVKVRTYPNINEKVEGGKTQLKTRRNIDLHNTPFTYQVTYTESILQPFYIDITNIRVHATIFAM